MMEMRHMIYDMSILLTVFNDHFPIQTKKIYNRWKSKPWITPGILVAIRGKRH